MKVTKNWWEWASDLSAQRLRDVHDAIATHLAVSGSLTPLDALMLKVVKAEISKRYDA